MGLKKNGRTCKRPRVPRSLGPEKCEVKGELEALNGLHECIPCGAILTSGHIEGETVESTYIFAYHALHPWPIVVMNSSPACHPLCGQIVTFQLEEKGIGNHLQLGPRALVLLKERKFS